MNEDRNPRHWLLIAHRGEGKSTFAAALDPEHLVADLDGRWVEQKEVKDTSRVIRKSDPLDVVAEMDKMRPQLFGTVNTVIYDSGTAVLDYIQAKGRLLERQSEEAGKKYNGDKINLLKADTLRVLRLAALKWHCDVLWIFHTEDNMKGGSKGTRTTISKMEIERMKSNLNAVLTIVQDPKGMRGIRIEWSRYNDDVAAGQIIWDLDGMWKGVPEKLDTFLSNFLGTEGFNGNVYSNEWLFDFLGKKGVTFTDIFDMYQKLDIKEEPMWYDRNAWGALIKKALPEPTK
jgi:hypothetical protein